MVAFWDNPHYRFWDAHGQPDKSENIFGTWYQLSKHLTFYASTLISHQKGLKTNIFLFSACWVMTISLFSAGLEVSPPSKLKTGKCWFWLRVSKGRDVPQDVPGQTGTGRPVVPLPRDKKTIWAYLYILWLKANWVVSFFNILLKWQAKDGKLPHPTQLKWSWIILHSVCLILQRKATTELCMSF